MMTTKSNSGILNAGSISAENATETINWNDNKTQLIINTILINKSFANENNPEFPIETHLYLILEQAILELDNEQLRLNLNTVEFKDTQRIDESNPICVFTKSEEKIA